MRICLRGKVLQEDHVREQPAKRVEGLSVRGAIIAVQEVESDEKSGGVP